MSADDTLHKLLSRRNYLQDAYAKQDALAMQELTDLRRTTLESQEKQSGQPNMQRASHDRRGKSYWFNAR